MLLESVHLGVEHEDDGLEAVPVILRARALDLVPHYRDVLETRQEHQNRT